MLIYLKNALFMYFMLEPLKSIYEVIMNLLNSFMTEAVII